jgi:putative DNA primase/helicase
MDDGFSFRDIDAGRSDLGAEVPEFSDDALALEFTRRHGDDLLYVAEWNRWLHWDGARWVRDRTTLAFDRVRRVCRAHAERAAGDDRLAMAVASRQKVAAVEALARSDRRHARAADDFDADVWALNTPSGVVDLRTGKMRAHRRTDLHTKITAVSPVGDCPRWRSSARSPAAMPKPSATSSDRPAMPSPA